MANAVPLADIVALLDAQLRTSEVPDYSGAVNGLQVANSGAVSRVAVAVDASRAAIEAAASHGANLLIVHHGLFWSGVQPIVGVPYQRLRTLIANDIAVYSSHLPLDLHPTLGNNVQLARALGLEPSAAFARFKSVDIGVRGAADVATAALVERVAAFSHGYGGTVRTSVSLANRQTRSWAVCSGGGASIETLREAQQLGVDTLIVGEGPHHTAVDAAEHDLCVIYAGHYATETLGVQALGALLESQFQLPWSFEFFPTGL